MDDPYLDKETNQFAPLTHILAAGEAAAQSDVPTWVTSALRNRLHLLSPNGFSPPTTSPASDSVKLKSGYTVSNLSQAERQLTEKAVEKLNIDFVEALCLLRSYRVFSSGPAHWKDDFDAEAYLNDEEWWSLVLTFYFDERITAIRLLLLTQLRISDIRIFPERFQEFIETINDAHCGPKLPGSTLDAVLALSQRDIPVNARSSTVLSSLWAKQYIREQREYLEVLLLYWYNNPAAPGDFKTLLAVIDATDWGMKQTCAAFWNAEAKTHATAVTYCLVSLSIIAINLEQITQADNFQLALSHEQLPPAESSLLHPNNLVAINKTICRLTIEFPDASAPLTACWAFVLSTLYQSIEEGEIAAEYDAFVRETGRTPESSQPLWQRILNHCLPFLFPCLSAALASPSLLSPVNAQMLHVIKVPYAALPSMISLSYLTEEICDAMFAFADALYSHSSAESLRGLFWGLRDPDQMQDMTMTLDIFLDGERDVLDLAARRFPLKPSPLLRLLNALSGPPFATEQACADKAITYLSNLPYLTSFVGPTGSSLAPQPYELVPNSSTHYRVVKPHGYRISDSVWIPQYTHGTLVSSAAGRDSVVQWDFTESGWNGWLWLSDLLSGYVGIEPNTVDAAPKALSRRNNEVDPFIAAPADQQKPLPIQFDSLEEEERAVCDALELLAKFNTLDRSPDLGYLSDIKAAQLKAKIAFLALEKGIVVRSRKVPAGALHVITSMLSSHSGLIWGLLRAGTADLFTPFGPLSKASLRGGSAILRADKAEGSYETVFALFSLIDALTLEAQRSTTEQEHGQIKAQVLHSAFRFVLDQIWTANFAGWRYQDSKDRWRIGSSMAELFQSIAFDSMLGSGGNLFGAGDVVLSLLLVHHDGRNHAIIPLISMLASAQQTLVTALSQGKESETEVCQQAMLASLNLIHLLLSIRKRHSDTPTCLEKLLLCEPLHASTLEKQMSEPTSILLTCVLAHRVLPPSIPQSAALVLAALSSLSPDFAQTSLGAQSLLSMFSSDSERQLAALVALLEIEDLSLDLRVSVWGMLASFITFQPSLAVLIIEGHLGPLRHSNRPSRTVLDVATELVRSAEEQESQVLDAVFRMLHGVWLQVGTLAASLQSLRANAGFWQSVVQCASSQADHDVSELDPLAAYAVLKNSAHKMRAKSYAIRLLALELEYGQVSDSLNDTCQALTCVKSLFSNVNSLQTVTTLAMENSVNSSTHTNIQNRLAARVPELKLDTIRKPPAIGYPALDTMRSLGSVYLYESQLAYYKLAGLGVPPDEAAGLIAALQDVNCNWSMIDTQLAVTVAWSQLVQVALLIVRPKGSILLSVAADVVQLCADEDQTGDIVSTIHVARLATLIQLLDGIDTASTLPSGELSRLFQHLTRILTHPQLPPLESIRQSAKQPYHRNVLSSLYLALRLMSSNQLTLENGSQTSVSSDLDTMTRFLCNALRILLSFSSDDGADTWVWDVGLCVSCFQLLLTVEQAPPASVWLALATENDLLRSGLQYVASSRHIKSQVHGSGTRQVLTLFLSMTRSPIAAERLAVENLLGVLMACPVIAQAEFGLIDVFDERKEERSEMHRVWCLILALIVRLSNVLGDSSVFMNEVCGFARLVLPQLSKSLAWTSSGQGLSVPLFEELDMVTHLFSVIACRSPDSEAFRLLSPHVLGFLNSLLYSIQHEGDMLSSMHPSSYRERLWLDQAASEPSSSTMTSDYNASPVCGAVIQAALGFATTVIDALCTALGSFDVLQRDEAGWPFAKIMFALGSLANDSSPAQLATLYEYCDFCLDILRHTVSTASATRQTSVNGSNTPLMPYDPSVIKASAGQALESALLLAVSQMALIYYNPNHETTEAMKNAIRNDSAVSALDRLKRAKTVLKAEKSKPANLVLALERFITLRMGNSS